MFYEVQAIVDKQIFHNKPWYLVKWLHYPLSEATWQPPYTLSNVTDLLQKFEKSHGDRFDLSILHDTDYGIQKSDYVRKSKKNKKKRLKKNPTSVLAETPNESNQSLTVHESTSNSSKKKSEEGENVIEVQDEGKMENEDEENPERKEEKMEDEKNQKIQVQKWDLTDKEMINEEDENFNQIKEIFYLKNAEDGERYYLVEKEDGSLEKLRTGKVVRLYPLEFSTYLEGKIKERLEK